MNNNRTILEKPTCKYNITIYDTREDEVITYANVPASSEEEACKMVADKHKFIWIGSTDDEIDACYAIDKEYYLGWHQEYINLEEDLAVDIARVKAGETHEFRGLMQLFHDDRQRIEW